MAASESSYSDSAMTRRGLWDRRCAKAARAFTIAACNATLDCDLPPDDLRAVCFVRAMVGVGAGAVGR